MIKVEPLFEGDEFQTDVWAATDQVVRAMVKLANKKRELVLRFNGLIERCARRGFATLPNNLLRHEGNSVYALGDRNGPLLRAVGFFHPGQRKEVFVLIDFFEKHATKLRGNERERCKAAARIRDSGGWHLVRR